MKLVPLVFAGLALAGCGGAVIEPGHRGVLFDPKAGGLQHGVLAEGYHPLSSCFLRTVCSRIDEFDTTYSTRKEDIHTTSAEGLPMELHVAVIYRPIMSELYELDAEIGLAYYDEVVGPEFRSAARGVFARHSYTELQKSNEKIENEIEDELRRRIRGKHVEVASVTLEQIAYAPEIEHAVQAKLVGEQEAIRQKAALENDALRKKLEIEHEAEREKLRAENELASKKHERALASEQAAIDKERAETSAATRLVTAKATAEEAVLLAKAETAKKKAEAIGITPLTVAMHAYDALGQLGGTGTTILLGDWSRAPAFLFPPNGMLPSLFGAPKTPNAKPAKLDVYRLAK